MMYSVMYVNAMLRERNEETVDYHVMTTMMQAFSEVVSFGNEPHITRGQTDWNNEIMAGVDVEQAYYHDLVMTSQDWVTFVQNAEVPDEDTVGNNQNNDDDESSPSGIDGLYDMLVRDEVAMMMQSQAILAVDQANNAMETSVTESQREEKKGTEEGKIGNEWSKTVYL
jgi:hypothetical protein